MRDRMLGYQSREEWEAINRHASELVKKAWISIGVIVVLSVLTAPVTKGWLLIVAIGVIIW